MPFINWILGIHAAVLPVQEEPLCAQQERDVHSIAQASATQEQLPCAVLVQGKQLLYAQQEERDQLRRAGYNPILWGVADRAREVFSDVPQAWYQRLLELGNLQVSSWGWFLVQNQ